MPPHAAPDRGRALMRGWAFWWPVLLLAALPVLAHLPELAGLASCNPAYKSMGLLASAPTHILPGACTIDDNVGGTLQALGGAAANAWLAGTVPWWTPLVGLGTPLAAAAQPAVFFLPFVLLLHFAAGVVLLKLAMQILAGLFTFAVLRELGLGRAPALIGGGAFALNGSFAWFSHSMVLPVAFLPALVLGLERSRRCAAQGQPGGTLWISLGLAFSLAAGFPETAFMDGLLAALWALTTLFRVPAGARLALAGKIAAGGAAGLALSAPAWLSFADLLQHGSVGAHVFVFLNHLTAGQAATLLLPGIYGPPYADIHLKEWTDDGGYAGTAIACLAALALCGGARLRGLRWALAAWTAFWICAFFGEDLCHAIWLATPILNQVQITRYAMPSLEFAAAILAALAAEDWRRGEMPPRRAMAGAALTALLAAALFALGAQAHRFAWTAPPSVWFAAASVAEAALILATLLWLLARAPGTSRAAALTACVLLAATVDFALPELAGPRPGKQALGAIDYLRGHAGLTRVFAVDNQIPVNQAARYGVASIQADVVPAPLAWTSAATQLGGDIDFATAGIGFLTTTADQVAALRASLPRLQAAGTGYVVTASHGDPFAAAPLPGQALAYDDGHSRIYAIPHAPYASIEGGPCALHIESRLRQTTDCAAPARLLRRELFVPGWRAWIDGRKAGVIQSGGMFQSIALPAGHAGISWAYQPPHLRTMLTLSALGTAAIAALALHARKPRRSG